MMLRNIPQQLRNRVGVACNVALPFPAYAYAYAYVLPTKERTKLEPSRSGGAA